MRIQNVLACNFVNAQNNVTKEKNSTNPIKSKDTVSFGNSYNSLFAKAIHPDFNIKSYDEISSLFTHLWLRAAIEGNAKDSVAKTILQKSPTTFFRDTLKEFAKGCKAGLINHDEIIVERNGSPLITAYDKFVNFCDPINGRHHNDIKFGFDGDKVFIERLYDKAKFYDNHNLHSYTRYTTDFSESSTTYYKRNGEEDSLKSFFKGLIS